MHILIILYNWCIL